MYRRYLNSNNIKSIPSGAFNALLNLKRLYVPPFCDVPGLVEPGAAVESIHPNRQGCDVVYGVLWVACTPRTCVVAKVWCSHKNAPHIACKFSAVCPYLWCCYCLKWIIFSGVQCILNTCCTQASHPYAANKATCGGWHVVPHRAGIPLLESGAGRKDACMRPRNSNTDRVRTCPYPWLMRGVL